MQKFLDRTEEFLRDEQGSPAAEYALLASLIAGVIILAVAAVGQSTKNLYDAVAAAFP